MGREEREQVVAVGYGSPWLDTDANLSHVVPGATLVLLTAQPKAYAMPYEIADPPERFPGIKWPRPIAHGESWRKRSGSACNQQHRPAAPRPSQTRPIPSGPKPGRQGSLFAEEGNPDSRRTHEVDPDFLEFARREEIEEPEPVWEP
jgi:hypothetical protein